MAGNWGAFTIKYKKSGRGCPAIYATNEPMGPLLLVSLGDALGQVLMMLDVRRGIDVLDMLYFGVWLGNLEGVRSGNWDCSNWHGIHSEALC